MIKFLHDDVCRIYFILYRLCHFFLRLGPPTKTGTRWKQDDLFNLQRTQGEKTLEPQDMNMGTMQN